MQRKGSVQLARVKSYLFPHQNLGSADVAQPSEVSKTGPLPLDLKQKYQAFYKFYVAEGAVNEVNLSAAVREKLSEKAKVGDWRPGDFDEAVNEVVSLMFYNIYPRWLEIRKAEERGPDCWNILWRRKRNNHVGEESGKIVNQAATALYSQQPQALQSQFQDCIAAAVRCLEAVLLIPHQQHLNPVPYAGGPIQMFGPDAVQMQRVSPALPPRDEIKTRCKLAEILCHFTENYVEADVHLEKAAILMNKISDVDPLRYHVLALQVLVMRRLSKYTAAKHILKGILANVNLQGFPHWYYYFMSQKVDIALEEGDVASASAYMAAVAKHAESRQDVFMQLSFSLRRAAITMRCADLTTAAESLQAPHMFFSNPAAYEATQLLPLRFIFNLENTLLALCSGNAVDAKAIALRLQKDMENDAIKSQLSPFEAWQLNVVFFLISALVCRPVHPLKGYEFLKQGLKRIYGELPNTSALECGGFSEVTNIRRYISEAEIICYLSLVELKLAVGDSETASSALLMASKCLSNSPYLESRYKSNLFAEISMLRQATRETSKALQSYIRTGELAGFGSPLGQFALSAITILIRAGPVPGISGEALEKFLSGKEYVGYRPIITAAVQGVSSMRVSEIQNTKIHFKEVMQFSDKNTIHLKALSLLVLGTLFVNTSPDQAWKMLEVSRGIANQFGFKLLAAATAAVFIEVAWKKGMQEQAIAFEEEAKSQFRNYYLKT
ncbi:hypothetical protein HDU96_005929 [Phlyctochytrium bullatum]|nr:hypothetical protein HDU96_005929 [Phlyctochytrium bullatum]